MKSPSLSLLRLCQISLLVFGWLSLPASTTLHAGPKDLKSVAASKVKDLTMDATYGKLYFIVGGQHDIYLPHLNDFTVPLPDLFAAIISADSILFEEASPER